jgi:hypothetical protein
MGNKYQRAFGFMNDVAGSADDVADALRAARAAGNANAEGDIVRSILRSGDDEAMASLARMEADARIPLGPQTIHGANHPGPWPAGTEAWAAKRDPFDGIEIGPAPEAPDFTLDSTLFRQLHKAHQKYDQLRTGRMANLRHQNPDLVRAAASQINDANDAARAARAAGPNRAAEAAAIAAAAGGVGLLVAPTSMAPGSRKASAEPMDEPADLVESGNPADLRDEPVSTASVPAKPDPAYEARQILQKLNAMRRAAGGEVPEAQAMMAEVNRLLAMADETRNAPGYEPTMPTDYHGQATLLLQKLNDMRRQAGGEVPQAAQIMAEVRRLQAMGDKQRWSN